MPSANEITYDNPPRYLYDKPTRFTNLAKDKDDMAKTYTKSLLLRKVEHQAIQDTQKTGRKPTLFKQTMDSMNKKNEILKEEMARKTAARREKKVASEVEPKRGQLKRAKKMVFPARKVDQELMMFKEIFIRPQEEALEKSNRQ